MYKYIIRNLHIVPHPFWFESEGIWQKVSQFDEAGTQGWEQFYCCCKSGNIYVLQI